MGFVELFALGIAVAVVAVVVRAVRFDLDREVREWAGAYGLRVTPGNRPFIAGYLRTGRRLRFVCSVGGLLLPPLLVTAVDPAVPYAPSLNGLAAGYMVGTLWAELSLTRTGDTGTRAASMMPRRLPDYLPGRLRWGLRVAGLNATLLAVAALTIPPRDPLVTVQTSGALAITGVVVAAVVEAAQRWVLRRPQPFVAADLVAADDAVRSSSIHALAGSGIASLLLLTIGPAITLAGSDVQGLRWVMPWVAVSSTIGAIVAVRYYAYRAWKVRRPATPVPSGG